MTAGVLSKALYGAFPGKIEGIMLDFWNDPRRWDDVDPRKECFWMKRRLDVIDVRPKPARADQLSALLLSRQDNYISSLMNQNANIQLASAQMAAPTGLGGLVNVAYWSRVI